MNFYNLVNIMARLRGPDGCPWDLAQSLSDLRPYIMEEAMEVVDAIDSGDRLHIAEELGDLLFEIIFAARILHEEGVCDIDDIISAIADKMIERHPHIFGDKTLGTAEEVKKSWEEIKAKKRAGDSVLDGVSENLSALVVADMEDEIGDILFTVVNISRSIGVNPELALRKTNRKFSRRFRHMEKNVIQAHKSFRSMTIDEMEQLWENAKEALKGLENTSE